MAWEQSAWHFTLYSVQPPPQFGELLGKADEAILGLLPGNPIYEAASQSSVDCVQSTALRCVEILPLAVLTTCTGLVSYLVILNSLFSTLSYLLIARLHTAMILEDAMHLPVFEARQLLGSDFLIGGLVSY